MVNVMTVIRLAVAAAMSLAATAALAGSPVDDVNVFVGTAGHGHTYPGATVPFGFVQLSPDTPKTGWDGAAGYHYSESSVIGFSHTHLSGTGVGDLGDLLVMPVTGDLQSVGVYRPLEANRLASPFSHANESASPGYYRVLLDRYHVTAELTATAHAGLHRYTFSDGGAGHVVLDLVRGIGNHATAGELTAENDHRLTGYRTTDGWAHHRTVYFVIESSRPFSATQFEAEGKAAATGAKAAKGIAVRAALDFPADAAPVVLRVGLSAVSVEAAQKNLDAEVKGFDFDGVHASARQQWDEHLSRLAVEAADPAVRRTFYTALYHTMLAPTLYNDADGAYRGLDGNVHTGEGFTNYSTFSLWDTFRAEHPLLTLVEPERVNDFVNTALAFYKQSNEHALPMWSLANWETHCMVGYHGVPVVYDAYQKGFRGYDTALALKAMQDTALHSGNTPDDYDDRGYVASDSGRRTEGVARTLEYSYDDWCIARMATSLGQAAVAEHFDRRAKNYANVFDATTGFFRGRTTAGEWREPFDLRTIDFDNFTEANAWQYAFFVPQDVPALIKLHGGPDAFVKKLDACFDQTSEMPNPLVDVTGLIGQYSHGNEPCHHMAYLYALAGAQDQTARRVRQISKLEYDDTPGGLCGNDDCGQTSAWFVWSAIGLYPLNPADGRYVIGTPAVASATLKLDPHFTAGGTFSIVTHNLSNENIYVQSAKLGGLPLDRPWVTHDEISKGGTLELEMGMQPNRTWGGTLAAGAVPRFPITVDCSNAPDLQPFADRIKKLAEIWYPRELDLMRPDDATSPRDVRVTFVDGKEGVADTQNDRVTMYAKYFRAHPNDVGTIVHELTHVAQAYPDGAPGWFTEGFADYVRWFLYEPAEKRPHPDPAKAKYDDSYRTSAAFLNWVARKYSQAVLLKVDDDCRRGQYRVEQWTAYTGQTIEQLNDAWIKSLRPAKQ